VLFWGLLSHNVLTEFYILVSLAMIAACTDAESVRAVKQSPHARAGGGAGKAAGMLE
jgi:hypothetical protein